MKTVQFSREAGVAAPAPFLLLQFLPHPDYFATTNPLIFLSFL
jgi:hypothetical protein